MIGCFRTEDDSVKFSGRVKVNATKMVPGERKESRCGKIFTVSGKVSQPTNGRAEASAETSTLR